MMVDPYPIYRRRRDEAPVCWSDQWKAWVVSRFDDVAASLKDKENLSNENRQGLLFAGLTDDERQQREVVGEGHLDPGERPASLGARCGAQCRAGHARDVEWLRRGQRRVS